MPVPDLLYISNERLTLDEFEDGPCPVPPELAIEIISPDQTFGEMAEKATDYLNAGVLRVWVVDPKAKSITVFAPDTAPTTYRGERRSRVRPPNRSALPWLRTHGSTGFPASRIRTLRI